MTDDHYTDHIDTINELKREGRYSEAIKLLLHCVDLTESESGVIPPEPVDPNNKLAVWLSKGREPRIIGVAPWYYEQLAIIYRKHKMHEEEVEILERFDQQIKSPGNMPAQLSKRLVKARELLLKSK